MRDRFAAEVARRLPALGDAVARWRVGLLRVDEATRLPAVGELLARLPPPESDDELFIRDMIERTRARRTGAAEICRDIAALHARLPIPLGLVMPRPADSAADFRDDCRHAARLLGLPVHDPADPAIGGGFPRFVQALLDRPAAGVAADIACAPFAGSSGDLLDRRAA